jgi:hypothetical protein
VVVQSYAEALEATQLVGDLAGKAYQEVAGEAMQAMSTPMYQMPVTDPGWQVGRHMEGRTWVMLRHHVEQASQQGWGIEMVL